MVWLFRASQVIVESSDFTLSKIEDHRMCSSTYSLSRYLVSTLLDTRVSIVSDNWTKVLTIVKLTVQGMRARYYLKNQN